MTAERLTLGVIRELTVDLPDDTPVFLDIRCGETDQFHEPIALDGYAHVGNPVRRDRALYLGEVSCTAADFPNHFTPARRHYRRAAFQGEA